MGDDEAHARPRELVLDVGGVLLRSSMPVVLQELSAASGRSELQLKRHFDATLRDDLWTGRLALEEFWTRLLAFAGLDADWRAWNARMPRILSGMPGLQRLDRWSARVAITVLSNHRSEWVRPALAVYRAEQFIDRLLISSEIGACKPQREAFGPLFDGGRRADDMLFVDDRRQNLGLAVTFGLPILWADPDGAWMDRVDGILGSVDEHLVS